MGSAPAVLLVLTWHRDHSATAKQRAAAVMCSPTSRIALTGRFYLFGGSQLSLELCDVLKYDETALTFGQIAVIAFLAAKKHRAAVSWEEPDLGVLLWGNKVCLRNWSCLALCHSDRRLGSAGAARRVGQRKRSVRLQHLVLV